MMEKGRKWERRMKRFKKQDKSREEDKQKDDINPQNNIDTFIGV